MAAGQWYLVVNGAQAGPFSQDDVMARLRAGQIDRATLVFTAGMSQWTPLGQVPELAGAAASGFATPPPPPPGGQRAHEIDYKIVRRGPAVRRDRARPGRERRRRGRRR